MVTHKRITTFAGHNFFYLADDKMEKLLIDAIRQEINNGCLLFIVGTHGNFDKLVLKALRSLRKEYKNLEIEVALTSMRYVIKKCPADDMSKPYYTPYDDVKTIVYDIEKVYFKNRITISNRQMVDDSDTLICYVDTGRLYSGAKQTYYYAKRKGLKIVNLYENID